MLYVSHTSASLPNTPGADTACCLIVWLGWFTWVTIQFHLSPSNRKWLSKMALGLFSSWTIIRFAFIVLKTSGFVYLSSLVYVNNLEWPRRQKYPERCKQAFWRAETKNLLKQISHCWKKLFLFFGSWSTLRDFFILLLIFPSSLLDISASPAKSNAKSNVYMAVL